MTSEMEERENSLHSVESVGSPEVGNENNERQQNDQRESRNVLVERNGQFRLRDESASHKRRSPQQSRAGQPSSKQK